MLFGFCFFLFGLISAQPLTLKAGLGNIAGFQGSRPHRRFRLKKTAQTFNDGDVIFREGESSDTAYEIVSGNVEIA